MKHEIITSPARCGRFDSPLVRKQDYANGYIESRTVKQIGRSVSSVFQMQLQDGNSDGDGDGMQMSTATKEAADIRCIRNVYTFVLRSVYLKRMQKVCYGEVLTNYRCTRFTLDLVWPHYPLVKASYSPPSINVTPKSVNPL